MYRISYDGLSRHQKSNICPNIKRKTYTERGTTYQSYFMGNCYAEYNKKIRANNNSGQVVINTVNFGGTGGDVASTVLLTKID